MNKSLKIIGSVGVLTGMILIAKKVNNGWCPILPDATLATEAKEKAENVTEKVEHIVSSAETERMETLRDARDAFASLLAVKESNDVPENINYVEDSENDVQIFTLGAAEGELVPFSDEYKAIINSAYEKSLKDEDFELRFFGSTYGIGTKGREHKDGSRLFAKDDIAKLKNKLDKS